MSKILKWVLSPIAVVFFTACSDVFETDITNSEIVIILPQDSLVTEQATQLFWWEELQGVAEYEIQIVSPSFNNQFSLITDTSISNSTKFQKTLDPGNYQWRIRAKNSGFVSDWVLRNLTIDTTTDLSRQTILLISPVSSDTDNVLTKNYSWSPIYSADQYEFAIASPGFSSGNIIYTTYLSTHNTVHTLSNQGGYEWRVKAINQRSESPFSSRKFFVDTASPEVPSLISPTNNAFTVGPEITFTWSRIKQTNGSSEWDSLYLASDSLFASTIEKESSKNKSMTKNLQAGTYFWKVQAFDKAGNKSIPSSFRRLVVQ